MTLSELHSIKVTVGFNKYSYLTLILAQFLEFMRTDGIETEEYLGRHIIIYSEYVISEDLDGYISATYGERELKRYFSKTFERLGDEFSGIDVDNLARILQRELSFKWKRLIDLANQKYDALKPFNIKLDETTNDDLVTGKDKTTYDDNEHTYGFNSVSAVPTDLSKGSSSREYERSVTLKRDYTRIGNIGNTSFQELVEQERNVAKYNLREILIHDIVTTLCRSIYK